MLVVDDNLVNQKVIVGMLGFLGYETDVAADGVEAVESVTTSSYDVVLMDIYMPNMDGFEATREIRRRETERYTPIVAVTASGLASDREECFAAGMDDCLVKPVDRGTLAAVLLRMTDAT